MTMTISKDEYEYVKDYSLNIDAEAEETTPVYYPVSAQKNITNAYATNLSQDYTVKAGNKAQFKFYNYTVGTDNFKSWVLGVSNVAHGAAGYKEYVMLRNDNWENIAWNNTGCTSDFNWDTFVQDMNGSLVDMTVEYAATGAFKMTAVITTKDKKVYHYSYSKAISDKPAKINVFFTGENSYIDGSSLVDTGIAPIVIQKKQNDGKCNEDGHLTTLTFDFLDKGRKYEATIYADAKDADYEKNPKAYTITKKTVKQGQTLKINEARGGGFAISLKAL